MPITSLRMKPMEERILTQRIYGILESFKKMGERPDAHKYTLVEVVHALKMNEYLHPIPFGMSRDCLRMIKTEVQAGRMVAESIDGKSGTFYSSVKLVKE